MDRTGLMPMQRLRRGQATPPVDELQAAHAIAKRDAARREPKRALQRTMGLE
jgi:hypothetical protein